MDCSGNCGNCSGCGGSCGGCARELVITNQELAELTMEDIQVAMEGM